MNNKKAVYFYHHPQYRYNCAQAVAYRWKNILNIPEDLTTEMSKCGAGRAPSGMCGALYSATQVIEKTKGNPAEFIQQFNAKIGAISCRTIRANKMATCKECVNTADELLEEHLAIHDMQY
ncbi:hypothetical protein DMA11_13305 [Marinilabiliaceae bacterium JC017]|nr:hypothetical protein DMA11_13305 [Marinilabiliaceae bacterium JC017]